MDDVKSRYFARLDEFGQMMKAAWAVSEVLAKTEAETVAQTYAGTLFMKLVAHGASLTRLLPTREPTPGLVWDLSSIAAISRCMMDAFHTLAYLCFDEISEDEQTFRIKLLALHDADRTLQVAKSLGSSSAIVDSFNEQLEECRSAVRACPFFASLSPADQVGLLKKPRDSYMDRKERNQRSSVDDDFYVSGWIYLSQFAHSHGFAIHQLQDFEARTEDAYRAINIPLGFAMAFLARSVIGMHNTISLPETLFSSEEKSLLQGFSMMACGFPDGSDLGQV